MGAAPCVQVHVLPLGSETSRVILSVSPSPALAALRANGAAQAPLGPCGRALPARERRMDGEPLSQVQEGGGG